MGSSRPLTSTVKPIAPWPILFAARLLVAGIRVSMLGNWLEGIAALRENGVVLLEHGTEKRYPVEILTPGEGSREFDLALVLVKSWQTERSARQLKHLLSPGGVALTLQNGLGNQALLESALGVDRVASG